MPHTSPFAGRADLSSLWPQPLAPGLPPPPELALPNDRGDGWQAGRQRLRSAAALRLPVAVMLRNPEPLWLQRPVRAAAATDGATRRDSIEPVSESQAIAHHPGGSWHSGSLRLTRSEFCVQWPSRFPASCAAVEAGSSGGGSTPASSSQCTAYTVLYAVHARPSRCCTAARATCMAGEIRSCEMRSGSSTHLTKDKGGQRDKAS